MNDQRNPHVGAPFTDDDAAIAAAVDDVSVPVLLCSLVHMTGDPSWIRDVALPRMPGTMDLQSGLDADVLADLRRRAVPAIAAYRDGGCVPHELPRDVVVEMMAFLAGTPLEGVMVPMFVEDMQFDGADSGAISWGDEVSDEAKAASPVVVIGVRPVGHPRRDPPDAGRPPVRDRREGRGPGRDLVGEPVPGGACRRRQPPLLLRVRAVAPLERVLLPAARAARLLRRACSTNTSSVRGVASAPR